MSQHKGKTDAHKFMEFLQGTDLRNNTLCFGNFRLKGYQGVANKINWSNRSDDLLKDRHEYTFRCSGIRDVQVSLQLYLNIRNHYRLFAYTRAGNIEGMAFSINLTTKKDARNIIFLEQIISFKEQYPDAKDGGAHRRQQKQILLCDILRRLGLEVDDDCRLVLGIFDLKKRQLLDASREVFLNNFIVASLLKGHFQGNKGFELDMLPSLQESYDLFAPVKSNPKWTSLRTKKTLGRSAIPLSVRYKVLARDGSICRRCGRTPGAGIVLHLDHKKPVSLGGDNSLKNLWTLCNECNLGKGNRIID